MRKSVVFLVVSVMLFSLSYAKEYTKPFKFEIVDRNDAAILFEQSRPYFVAMSEGKNPNKKALESIIKGSYTKNGAFSELIALFGRAHIMESENEGVRDIVKRHLGKTIPSKYSKIIKNRYNAKQKILDNDKVQYENNGLFDEGIFFHLPMGFQSVDKRLIIFAPTSQWQVLSNESSPNKIIFMCGGQTVALSMNVNMEKYKQLPKNIKSSGDIIVYDISNEGICKFNNADKTILEITDNGPDEFRFNMKLFDEKSKNMYRVQYSYNMSEINMNYEIFDELKKHLLYYSFLLYLVK